MKLCGLYIRVSTEKQAKVEEGSLKNQDHHLTQHVQMKSQLGKESWTIVERYVDEGISAKNTNRPAYQKMIQDIEHGRINTVLCLALSRISRSTRDLLDLVDFFGKHQVDFICLKEDVDTTSPMGRLLLTFMGGLNQFEREQTGDRTRAALLARAERGLWNGGQIVGYDIDLARKGYLLVNEQEAQVVRLAYDTYLEVGSVLRTAQALNAKGYRTKSFTSRRGKLHPSARFSHSNTYKMLTNPTYIGKKEIYKTLARKPWNREEGESPYRIVDAVWPGILDPGKYHAVQKLLRSNYQTRNNGSAPTKHFYLLNGGLLYCHKCGARMTGRNGHGHKGRKAYFYYYCTNKACLLKYPQEEIEKAAGDLMLHVSKSQRILKKTIGKLNQRLKKSFPKIEADKRAKEIELKRVSEEAQRLLASNNWSQEAKGFVDEQLRKLGDTRKYLEEGLARLRSEVSAMTAAELTELDVKGILDNAGSAIFDDMRPYQRKELLQNTIRRFEISNEALSANVKLQTASSNSEWTAGQPPFSEPPQGVFIWPL